jgi:hypothetical protein
VFIRCLYKVPGLDIGHVRRQRHDPRPDASTTQSSLIGIEKCSDLAPLSNLLKKIFCNDYPSPRAVIPLSRQRSGGTRKEMSGEITFQHSLILLNPLLTPGFPGAPTGPVE